MEVRIESMVCVWDDTIPTMFIEFVNLLTLATSEGQLRRSVKDFAEKHELDRFFLYGFGSHHFYLHQRYTSNPEMVMQQQSFVSTFLTTLKINDYGNTNDHQRSKHLHGSRYGEIRAFPIRYRQTQADTCAVRLPPSHKRRVVLLCQTHIGRVPSRTGQVAARQRKEKEDRR